MKVLESMNSKLTELSLSVAEVRGEIHELRVENKTLKKEVSVLKQENEAIKSKLLEVEYANNLAMKQANDNAQYSRINNLRWYGVKEVKDENLSQRFTDMVTDKLGLHEFKRDSIEAIHRLGRPLKKGKPRPIIVRLRRNARDEIMESKKKLAKSGMSLMEDLTKPNLQLYNKVKDHQIVKSAWTIHGKIMICVKDSEKVVRVSSYKQLIEHATEWVNWVKPKPQIQTNEVNEHEEDMDEEEKPEEDEG